MSVAETGRFRVDALFDGEGHCIWNSFAPASAPRCTESSLPRYPIMGYMPSWHVSPSHPAAICTSFHALPLSLNRNHPFWPEGGRPAMLSIPNPPRRNPPAQLKLSAISPVPTEKWYPHPSCFLVIY
jgi:hypothetical protein